MTAPFELKMTEQEAFDGLKKQFGTEFTTPEVRAFCAMNDIAYATVTRKISQYKVGKGKWNLTVSQKVVDKIENSYSAPSVEPVTERTLSHKKMILSSSLARSPILRRLFLLSYFTLLSSLVYQVMEKLLVLNKSVLN